MAGTVAALNALRIDDAVFGNPNGVANLDSSLFSQIGWADSASGANLRAAVAFGAAISTFVAHLRLHEAVETRRWAQHTVRASADAELASRAMLGNVAMRA